MLRQDLCLINCSRPSNNFHSLGSFHRVLTSGSNHVNNLKNLKSSIYGRLRLFLYKARMVS
ncbi:hypothetical protein JMJ77_0008415 [Colletotrichum scovillei]|uniref:Uncharacterized protein n=1 Tax=Colletotrichum scovillei TaxID=1209932 RepID=A0A9P7RGY9_9PEZI|nr:hypothetical protein JMJ77_0008415 [Colletotrichum scovillei]KAG7075408.1 hypothetical protein JMJ76_0011868 [Colletotrichum scovillei]KAG7082294.1 hypothetical protein JMJ78_0004397 [Colletotrichum scovillei]